ncbi:MAG: TauD/TfdA dioxygenase family protein [Hyphomicrobiaceae bacterium]
MRNDPITVEPVAGALGAEVGGIDLARLDAAAVSRLREAFLEHQVLFFRNQDLSPEAYVAFASRFGRPVEYPFAKGVPGFPVITEIIREPDQKTTFGGYWHSDTTYKSEPPKSTMLYCLETPKAGGDTAFANMYRAYETLSPGMRRLLDGLQAVSSSKRSTSRSVHLSTGSMQANDKAPDSLQAEHPVVRTHPETGRKALFINPTHTTRFVDMTEAESRPLLEFLFQHAQMPEFTCRFRWAPGSVAIWDNRCTWHKAIADYDGHRRVMRRITIAGDRPA